MKKDANLIEGYNEKRRRLADGKRSPMGAIRITLA
jgi:hypothetical protein